MDLNHKSIKSAAHTGITDLRMTKVAPSSIHCPHCAAEYRVVRIEAPPSQDRAVECLSCGGPLPAREGALIVKYFFVGKLGHRRKRSP
jgi:predicted Zn finger-like uncharacterized protein